MASERPEREVCIVVRFPDSTEIRSVRRPPRRGQRVESRHGDVWFVTDVVRSGLDTYTVWCAGSREFLHGASRGSRRDLASDLLAATRRVIRSQTDEEMARAAARERRRALDRRASWVDKYLSLGSQYGRVGTPSAGRPRRSNAGDWLDRYLRQPNLEDERADTAPRRSALRRLLGTDPDKTRAARS